MMTDEEVHVVDVPILKIEVTWKEVTVEIDRMAKLATAQDPDVRRFALEQIARLYACYLYPREPYQRREDYVSVMRPRI